VDDVVVPALQERRAPFGIGVLAVPAAGLDPAVRLEERLTIALTAHAVGYYLLDTIEIDASARGIQAARVVDQLFALAVRTDAQAFFVRGAFDGYAWLEPMAEQLRVAIRRADDPLAAALDTIPDRD